MIRYENSIDKFFVERDLSQGQEIRFQTIYPPIFFGKITKATYLDTINNLNHIYSRGNSNSWILALEFCLNILTFYTYSWCFLTYYQRNIQSIDQFIENQNITIYNPQGIHIIPPSRRSHLILEIVCFNEFSELEDVLIEY